MTLDAVLSALVDRAAPVLADRFPTNSLLATRAVVEVLTRLDLAAAPVPVSVTAMNAVYREKLERMARDPNEADVREWVEMGGWAVGSREHVIATASGASVGTVWLLDPASGQFHRPDFNVEVPPVFLAPFEDYARFSGGAMIGFEAAPGTTLAYRVRPSDLDVERFWHDLSAECREAADEILKLMGGA